MNAQALLRAAVLASDHDERYELLDRLGRAGVQAERDVSMLAELLGPERDWFPRSLAAWELGKLGPDAADSVPALAALAAERDLIIDPRWASLWALERLGPASVPAVPTLVELLRDDHEPDMRSQAAQALGAVGDLASRPALAAALGDEDSLVREQAAGALGRLGPAAAEYADAVERLAIDDDVRPVREVSLVSLRRLGAHAAATRVESAGTAHLPPRTLTELLANLASDDARVRAESTWPIGKLGGDAAPGASAIVSQLLSDRDPDARWGAAWCMGRLGPDGAAHAEGVAAAARDDRDPDVRANAAQALGRIRQSGDVVVGTLVDALADEGASLLREEAAGSLGRLGPPAAAAVPALRSRLLDPHPLVRLRAEAAIVAIQGYA